MNFIDRYYPFYICIYCNHVENALRHQEPHKALPASSVLIILKFFCPAWTQGQWMKQGFLQVLFASKISKTVWKAGKIRPDWSRGVDWSGFSVLQHEENLHQQRWRCRHEMQSINLVQACLIPLLHRIILPPRSVRSPCSTTSSPNACTEINTHTTNEVPKHSHYILLSIHKLNAVLHFTEIYRPNILCLKKTLSS